MEFKQDFDWKNKTLLYLNMGMTLICILLSYLRERIQLEEDMILSKVEKNSTLCSSGRIFKLWINWALLCIHPYPFFFGNFFLKQLGKTFQVYNQNFKTYIVYHFNDIFQIGSFIRLIFILNKLMIVTKWKNSRSERVW